MKSYAAYMKEISANEIYEGLLGYGMFSEKLPQIFTSEELLRFNSIGIPERWHSYIRYNSMRNTNVTREIGIPNPIAYMSICSVIKENWDKIQDHFMEKTRGQNHNVSRIHIRKMHGTKSLFKMNYENWKLDGSPEDDLIIGSRYIVRADISKCFPSIYSHSVPWALVGKTEAKCKSSKKYDSCWFNKIDKCSTYCKSGETHGLLIGPHTSSLLAEIILTTIDKELYNKKWRYIRCIDDYTCYVDSMEVAQLFLIPLKAELGKFDLSLNDKKTEILALPVANTKQWIRKLYRPEQLSKNGVFDYKSARMYFDDAIELLHNCDDNAAILNYAIKALPIDAMSRQAKSLCIKIIFHLCLMFPYLVQIMDEFVFEKFNVDVAEIKTFASLLYEQEHKVKNYDAVCYALYFAIKYEFKVDNVSVQDAIESDSCIYKLLAYMYFKKNVAKREEALLKSHAEELSKIGDDFERNWLFIFEVLGERNLKDEWKSLKEQNISFIRPKYRFNS